MVYLVCTLTENEGKQMRTMPILNLETINASIGAMGLDDATATEWKAIAKAITVTRGKPGQLRASKPKVKDSDPITGKAAYVWRMVCFLISPKGQHHCMPITADFDLPAFVDGKWSSAAARDMSKVLKPLEDAIVNSVPKTEWYGVRSWASAMYGR